MTTNFQERVTVPVEPEARRLERRGIRLDRVVAGLLVFGLGAGWLIDQAGVSVPWRVLPAAALVLVGVALAVTAATDLQGRGELIALGVVLLFIGMIAATGARYVGPVGDRTVAPTVRNWPVETRLGAGTLTIDLTEHRLPDSGRLEAVVGAGTIVVRVPDEARVRIHARVGAGEVTANGVSAENGIDVHWVDRVPTGPAVVLELRVGAGKVEVHDE